MSLERYYNKSYLTKVNGPQYGQTFKQVDLSLLNYDILTPIDSKIANGNRAELHFFSFSGEYIGGDYDSKFLIRDSQTNSLLINAREAFTESGIDRGSFRIVVNLYKDIFGNPFDKFFITKEISPDKTEIKFLINSDKFSLQEIRYELENLKNSDILNDLVLNFGKNQIYKIINARIDKNFIYFKLYNELDDDITELSTACLSFEIMDPYVDTVILTSPEYVAPKTSLRGPNFDLDSSLYNSNSTSYKTWNDLLDSDLPTTQRIIDSIVSSSGTATLNVDYTNFENFIFYSSAEERVKNFKYKLEKIETYERLNNTLSATSGALGTYVQNSAGVNTERINIIRSNFDPFERWLYYHSTSSIFTHDITGSITPYPKYISNGAYVPHHTTSSIATEWYNKLEFSSSQYDLTNNNRLWWAIPEHILMDDGNSNFILFVDMIGQHFDNIYSYIKALTKIHERDEHPERGPSNELLWYIAKSFGWNLQNARQLGELWEYKLGTTQSGSYASTGSMFSLSQENQTCQIWRRVVNNLPYLLKTKGTDRSIKALMSIYGIPQTLMSIKEYGGPSVATDKPALIEDRFYYTLNFTGSQYIELPRRPIPITSGSWNGTERSPDTYIFRFNTHYSSSLSQSLWAIEQGGSRSTVLANLDLIHQSTEFGTASYSGSHAYGKLRLKVKESGSSTYVSSSTNWLPLYDDDFWTVRLWRDLNGATESTFTGSINVQVARSSDNLYGRIPHSASFQVTNSTPSLFSTSSRTDYIVLGGTTGSSNGANRRFIGEIHGYKEYFDVIDESTFFEHVLNPGAYNVVNETGSFYSLYRYFPLGLDVQRWDHTTYTQVSSSHPNRKSGTLTTGSFYNFTGTQSDQYTSVKETYYVTVPSLGGRVLRNDKVRLENSILLNDLNPSARSEKSAYDKEGFDSNKLAIVFSPTDQVDRDIFNHMGFAELDAWIGSPAYEFENEYSGLRRFSDEYWQKYQQKYDINAFINILSIYDYTFFEQIKQLVPGRADLVAGILIEPYVLSRPKVQLTKRPTVENPQWDKTIELETTMDGTYIPLETVVNFSQSAFFEYDYHKTNLNLTSSVDFEYTYHKTNLNLTSSVDFEYVYYTGSIVDAFKRLCRCSPESKPIYSPWKIYGESIHHLNFRTGSSCVDDVRTSDGLSDSIQVIRISYSGSTTETQSIVDSEIIETSGTYWKVKYHYSGAGDFNTKYEKQWASAVSKSYKWHYSSSLEPTNYQINEYSSQNNSRFIGTKLIGAGINIDSPNTIDGGPVIQVWESNPSNLNFLDGNDGNLTV